MDGRDTRAVCIDHDLPLRPEPDLGQDERDRFRVCVEEQQEPGVGDAITTRPRFADRPPFRNTASDLASAVRQSSCVTSAPAGVSRAMSPRPSDAPARSWPRKNRRRRNTGCAWRSADSARVKSVSSCSSAARLQSIQEISLSWQYALLFPCWLWPSSSPATIIGTPCDKSKVARRLRFCLLRSAMTPGPPSVLRYRSSRTGCWIRRPYCLLCWLRYDARCTHQVLQREPVVRRNKVDAGGRVPVVVPIQVRTAGETFGEFARSSSAPASNRACSPGICRSIPPSPAGIARSGNRLHDIPGLSDQLDLGDDRVLENELKKADSRLTSCSSRASAAARSNRNPSTCISRHPITKAVHDHSQHIGQPRVQRIPRTGKVKVVSLVIGKAIIFAVVNPTVGQGRAQLISFGSMVVDHIQEYFDPRLVQLLDHRPEFVYLPARCPV